MTEGSEKVNVLIVEDEVIIALDIQLKLEKLGYAVAGIANSVEAALVYLNQGGIDLVLLDIQLEGKENGIDLAEIINKQYIVPVVFVTSNSNEKIYRQVIETAPYGYIIKPFEDRELKFTLAVAISKFQYEKKLKDLNHVLDLRVKQRTQEIQNINQQLQQEIVLRNSIEELLIEKEEEYKSIVNNIKIGILVLSEKMQIIKANNYFLNHFQFKAAHVSGKTLEDILPHFSYKYFIKLLSNDDNLSVFELEKPDRSRAFVKLTIVEQNVNRIGNERFLVSIEDVSKEYEIKEQLKAERLLRIKSLLEGEHKERKRISKELHDGLGQKLTAIKLNLGALSKRESIESTDMEIIRMSKGLVEDAVTEVRVISHNLSPLILSDFGIDTALDKLCSSLSQTGNVDISYMIEGETPVLDKEVERNVYRIVQEALNNAIKHSKGDKIEVSIVNQDHELCIHVRDNGIGFDSKNNSNGRGLYNIEERCNMINADFDIFSSPGSGTTVKIILKKNSN